MGDRPARVEDELAASLGLDVVDLVERFGAGWQRVDPSAEQAESSMRGQPWFVAGEPPQLMLQPTTQPTTRGVLVARPVGRWLDWGAPTYEPADVRSLVGDPSGDAQVIGSLVRARRSSFRYCALCRRLTPPEYREGAECMSCGERWRGVVH